MEFLTTMLTDLFKEVPFIHIFLEFSLFIWVIYLIFRKSSPSKNELKRLGLLLSDKEKEQLLHDWTPEPLIDPIAKDCRAVVQKVVKGKVGKVIEVDGHKCLNFATHNYIGFIENKVMEETAVKAVSKYGVGSCGPRGFYGTVDVHLELEERLARFMEVQEAIIYSYGFATISSAIPAYAKRGDVIFVDEGVNFAVQMGLEASRSEIKFFKHNDMEDLEILLKQQADRDKRNPKKAEKTRRFLIVEGIYAKTGDVCPLPELVNLRKKYKLRIFIDESISVGTLGKHGKGVTEYFNIPRIDVDLIMASMENSIASIGGFCVGSSFIVEHQRLSGLGYCFSASLPPLLASAAIAALDTLEQNPAVLKDLNERCHWMQSAFGKNADVMKMFDLLGHPDSPVKHLRLKDYSRLSIDKQLDILNLITGYCIKRGFAIITASYLYSKEKFTPAPSIRLTTSVLMTHEEIKQLVDVIEEASVDNLINEKLVSALEESSNRSALESNDKS